MLPFGNISKRIFTHTASHYASKHTIIPAIWQARKCRRCAGSPPPRCRHSRPTELGAVATRNDSQKARGEATYTALPFRRPGSPSSLKLAMSGVEGERPSSFSGGYKGGILFEKRIPPLMRAAPWRCLLCTSPTGKILSPEARSCRGRRAHGSAGAARSAPPAHRCWTRRGSSRCPSPW